MTPTDHTARPAHWKIALAGLFLFVLLGILLEGGMRWYLRRTKGYDGKHLYQFAFDPYKNILPTPSYVDTRGVRHNAVGFRRSSEVSLEKPPGTFRIFLMGASTAYGLGGLWPHIDASHPVLKNSETIDAYLEAILGRQFPGHRFEVINAAITSTWTHHNLIYLNQTILRYHPDMVLFLDGYNDFYQYDPGHDQFASYSYSLPSRIIMGDPTWYSLGYAGGWWLFRKSALVHELAMGARNLKLLLTSRPPRRPIDVEKAVAAQARNFTANALKMEERSGVILQHEGVLPVFLLQPMLILERGRTQMPAIERRLFEFNVTSYLPNYEAYITRAVQFVREQEAAMAARVGGTFIDLTTIYREAEGQIFTDYAHLTPQGNRLAAEAIARAISPRVASRITP